MNGTGDLNATKSWGVSTTFPWSGWLNARAHAWRGRKPRVRASIVLLGVLGAACAQPFPGQETPIDRPNYPTGLALQPSGEHLAVISSNSDLGYARGALLLADVGALDADLAADASLPDTLADAPVYGYGAGIYLPSFGGRPTFSTNGENLFLTTREENQLHQIDVATTGSPALRCDGATQAADATGDCGGISDRNLSIPGNDPYSVALLRDDDTITEGLVASLLSTDLVLFRYDADSERLRQRDTFALNALVKDDVRQATGVRALEVIPANAAGGATAFALVEHTALTNGDPSVELWWFSLDALPPNQVQRISLTELTGARSAMDLEWVPTQNALLVLLREPDSVARFELAAPLPDAQPRLSAVREICREPITLRVAQLPDTGGGRTSMGYVTCYGEHAVISIDPLTLRTSSVLRFAGYGPFDLVIQADHQPPRAFVSFFLDDSVGVLDLVRDDVLGLFPRARFGDARPQPERGTR